MSKALKRCDVAIGALRVPHGRTPCVVSEQMIRDRKSSYVDVSIDKGDVLKRQITTHENPTLKNMVLFTTVFQILHQEFQERQVMD